MLIVKVPGRRIAPSAATVGAVKSVSKAKAAAKSTTDPVSLRAAVDEAGRLPTLSHVLPSRARLDPHGRYDRAFEFRMGGLPLALRRDFVGLGRWPDEEKRLNEALNR